MSSDSLISWRQEPPKPAETWADVIGVDNEAETYAYNLAAAEAEKARLEAEAAARLDDLSDTELLEKWQRAAAEEAAKTLPARQEEAARQFIVEAPEFALTPRNQWLVDEYFRTAKLDASSPDHFHQAYRALASRGLIQVDESKRPRAPRPKFNEKDLYEMPLDQLQEMAEGGR